MKTSLIPEDAVNPAILGYVISFKRSSCTDNNYIKCYLKGESSFCHVIRGVHQGHTYEVQVAAYNIAGEGKHSLPKLGKIYEVSMISLRYAIILNQK
ncbi:hypothetical protein KUTeg_009155 [Tegillarca granosa]|uniref:Fibronectin type-III domain-containing protein n=1 Tax=Tegillarca granosa TaxID=220873 RepID=A0ABQ9FAC1_TEGGR|nr:hypothetical protein KUTeg_009155 [Tegillarca granosa]